MASVTHLMVAKDIYILARRAFVPGAGRGARAHVRRPRQHQNDQHTDELKILKRLTRYADLPYR